MFPCAYFANSIRNDLIISHSPQNGTYFFFITVLLILGVYFLISCSTRSLSANQNAHSVVYSTNSLFFSKRLEYSKNSIESVGIYFLKSSDLSTLTEFFKNKLDGFFTKGFFAVIFFKDGTKLVLERIPVPYSNERMENHDDSRKVDSGTLTQEAAQLATESAFKYVAMKEVADAVKAMSALAIFLDVSFKNESSEFI